MLFPSPENKKAIFDRYGEEGLKAGAGGGGGGGGAGGPFAAGYSFQGDPRDIFSSFFNGKNVFDIFDETDHGGMGMGMGGGFSKFGGGMGGGGRNLFMGRGFGDDMDFTPSGFSSSSKRQKQDPPVEHDLNVTLEELFNGCTKKMKIHRKVASGQSEDKILAIEVKAGWKAGTKITYPREGDQLPGRVPADIVFVVREKPHAHFTRDGSDLKYAAKISLRQALCGGAEDLSVPTVDGSGHDAHPLKGKLGTIVSPSTVVRLEGRGMPLSKSPGKRGDMLVTFDIAFPEKLSTKQVQELKKILA